MMREARRELHTLLREVPTVRPPALRRALTDEALLATDLPLCAEETAVEAFIANAETRGWRAWPEGNWLLLDREMEPRSFSNPPLTPEGRCCASLLERHPGGAPDPVWVRRLLKAGEEGGDALEACCRALHRELAARLRRGESLPDVRPWLNPVEEEEETC